MKSPLEKSERSAGSASPGERGAHGGVVFTPAPLARRLVAELPSVAHRILDPACGDGALLAAALECATVGRHLFGLEIEPALAERARTRLAALLATGTTAGPSSSEVQHTDALSAPWPRATYVLANPPWLSFSGRHASPAASAQRRRFELRNSERRASAGAGGWPSLQSLFLERIAQHVESEDTGAAVLLPASLLEAERYGPLRALVLEHARLARPPIELAPDAFPAVNAPAVIVVLAPRTALDGAAAGPASWLAPAGRHVLEQRFARFPRLAPSVFADPGVHTGNAAAELVRGPDDRHLPGLRQGRDLTAFDLGPPSARLATDVERTDERRFRVHALEHYAAFPVLVRQTAKRPVAALHERPTYFRNSLLACRTPEGLDPAFLAAILNSSVAEAWHTALFRDARQKSFPQVKVGHLRTQPFPIAHRDENPGLHDEVARRVRALEPCSADFQRETRAIDGLIARAFDVEPQGSSSDR